MNEVGIAGFAAMRALSLRNDDPKRALAAVRRRARRLRDGRGRRGARARGARAREGARREDLRARSSATACPPTRSTSPSPIRPARSNAFKMALDDAGVAPEDIDYINAHATSTPVGDSVRDADAQVRARRGDRATRRPSPARKARRGTASAAPARSRRRSRSSRSATGSCRRRSTTRSPIRRAISTTSRTSRATRT